MKNRRIITQIKGFDYSRVKHDWVIEALFRAWINKWRFKNAIRIANAKKKATGKEYMVVEGTNVLWVFNSYERIQLCNRGVFKRGLGHHELIQKAGYYTGWNDEKKSVVITTQLNEIERRSHATINKKPNEKTEN